MLEMLIEIYIEGLRDKTTLNLQNESDGSSRDPDEEANDCIKDRKNALEDKSVSLVVCQMVVGFPKLSFKFTPNLSRISFFYPNVQWTADTSAFNATDQQVIVGAFMKIPESQFLAAAQRTNSHNVILTFRFEQCKDVHRKMNFSETSKSSLKRKSHPVQTLGE